MSKWGGKLNIYIGANTSEVEKSITRLSKKINRLGKQMESLGKSFSESLTVPITAIGAAAVKSGMEVEKALKAIRIGTGATGDALKGLNADFKAIAASVPNSIGESAQAIADLNTLTGATGKTLQDLATATLDASRMMGTNLGSTISSVGKLLNNWNLGAEKGVTVLDKLFYAAQSTGMGLDSIAQSVTFVGSSLREMGFSLDESIALVSSLDKAGINVSMVTRSLSHALSQMAKSGVKDSSAAFKSIIESIKNAKKQSEATTIAVQTFGTRVGPQLAASIREGRLEIASFSEEIKNAGGTVAQTAKDTEGFSEKWAKMTNQMTMALEPLGTRILQLVMEDMEPLAKAIGDLSIDVSDTTIKWAAYGAALGPVLIYTAAVVKSIGELTSGLKTLTKWFSGPVGLTIAIGTAMVGLSEYLDTSDNVITVTDDTRDSVNRLTQSFQNLSLTQINSRLAEIAVEFEKITSKAKAARAEFVRLQFTRSAFGDNMSLLDPSDRAEARRLDKLLSSQSGNLKELGDAKRRLTDSALQLEEAKSKLLAADAVATEVIEKTGGNGKEKGKGKTGGGSSRSGQSAIDSFVQGVQDRMRYMKDDGLSFMDTITAMQSKLKPLSDDWKKLEDLRLNIDSGSISQQLQEIQDRIRYLGEDGANFIPKLQEMAAQFDPLSEKGKQIADVLKSISDTEYSEKWSVASWEFSEGLMSAAQYASMLEAEVAGLAEGTEKWRARFSELQNIKTSELSTTLESISRQFENGALSSAEYETALTRLAEAFADFPKAAKMATDALADFRRQNELTTVSLSQQLASAMRETTKNFQEMQGKAILGVVDGFSRAIAYGDDFGDTLKKLGQDIIYTTLQMIMMQKVIPFFQNMLGFSNGGVLTTSGVTPFASGGVVNEPTVFPMANGMGLMGEAGPEAIMPLTRDSSGRLGVVAEGMGEPTVIINVENNTGSPIQANQTGVSFDEQMQKFVVDVVLRDQATNGPISRNYRRAMR